MDRPTKFEDYRWLGDKRDQRVYDIDAVEDHAVVEDIVESDAAIVFGPDTLAEARNRGYRLRRM